MGREGLKIKYALCCQVHPQVQTHKGCGKLELQKRLMCVMQNLFTTVYQTELLSNPPDIIARDQIPPPPHSYLTPTMKYPGAY